MENNSKKDSKKKILECLAVLYKYSDKNHPLAIAQIDKKMQELYGSTPTCRQTMTSYFKYFNKMGIQIGQVKRKYYYDNRCFEDSEIELLCHSIMANNSIPLSFSLELIEKLKDIQGIHFASNKKLDFNICNVDKRENKELFLNLDTISEAINKNCCISFNYYRYNEDKHLVNYSGKDYNVAPLCTLAFQNRFYLIAINSCDGEEDYWHFRIDKIKNIKLTGRFIKKKLMIDPYKYVRHRLYMQDGNIEQYELEVEKNRFILDELVDVCGQDIEIEDKDDNHYKVIIKAPEKSLIFLACQYIQYVKVITPSIRNKVMEILNQELKEYEEIE